MYNNDVKVLFVSEDTMWPSKDATVSNEKPVSECKIMQLKKVHSKITYKGADRPSWVLKELCSLPRFLF